MPVSVLLRAAVNPARRQTLAHSCLLAGRLLCDTYLSARELVREVDYTLATLSRTLLNQERQDLAAADVPGK